ncbi:hypothetical protein ACFWPK_23085 [Nocardia sp. NPDC058519]|uniref:hypothetical protein n=1 Tax=Nocardia sp. NPDC058519 TaxID=3346535 RepID=UPI0036544220
MSRSRIEEGAYEFLRRVQILDYEYDEMRNSLAVHNNGHEILAEIQAVREREAAEAEERERLEAEERERQEAEAREQREAIARSIAARRANDRAAPMDDDDPEGDYYRRKSWLV